MMSTTPWWWDSASTIFAAIIGALLGAVPAFLLAKRSANNLLKRDAASRKEAKKSAIFRTSVKLLALVDVLAELRGHINSQIARQNLTGREKMELWQLVMPQTGHTREDIPTFDHDELAVLFEDGELDLMQQLTLLRRRCASAEASFREYCQRREAFTPMAPAAFEFEGGLAKATVTKEEIMRLKPYTIPMNNLVSGLHEHLNDDWEMAKELLEKFTQVARKHLEMPGFTVQLRDPT